MPATLRPRWMTQSCSTRSVTLFCHVLRICVDWLLQVVSCGSVSSSAYGCAARCTRARCGVQSDLQSHLSQERRQGVSVAIFVSCVPAQRVSLVFVERYYRQIGSQPRIRTLHVTGTAHMTQTLPATAAHMMRGSGRRAPFSLRGNSTALWQLRWAGGRGWRWRRR